MGTNSTTHSSCSPEHVWQIQASVGLILGCFFLMLLPPYSNISPTITVPQCFRSAPRMPKHANGDMPVSSMYVSLWHISRCNTLVRAGTCLGSCTTPLDLPRFSKHSCQALSKYEYNVYERKTQ